MTNFRLSYSPLRVDFKPEMGTHVRGVADTDTLNSGAGARVLKPEKPPRGLNLALTDFFLLSAIL